MVRTKTLKKFIRFALFLTAGWLFFNVFIDTYKEEDYERVTYSWQKDIEVLPEARLRQGGVDHVLLAQDVPLPSRPSSTTGKPTTRKITQKLNSGLTVDGKEFLFDGRPFRIIGGTFHYFRVPESSWYDRLLKMKAAGLNTVVFPVPWNIHEPVKGEKNFESLKSFLKMIDSLQLYAIIQVGPFVEHGLDWGGLPAWLLKENIKHKVRSSNETFLNPVRSYMQALIDDIYQYTYSYYSGPIIAFQIEHGFGLYIRDDTYLNFLVIQFRKNSLDEIIFLADRPEFIERDRVPQTVKCLLIDSPHNAVTSAVVKLRQTQPDYPTLIMSFPTSNSVKWSMKYEELNLTEFRMRLQRSIVLGNSFVFHPFIGGSNYEFNTGAVNFTGVQGLQFDLSSHYADAPVTESGEYEQKYFVIRSTLKDTKLSLDGGPPPPLNYPPRNYGKFEINSYMPYEELIELLRPSMKSKRDVLPMEVMGYSYGYILYRTSFMRGKEMNFVGAVHDYGLVVVNNKTLQKIDNSIAIFGKAVKLDKVTLEKSNTLDIFLENCGRVYAPTRLNDQRKGLRGRVLINNVQLIGYKIANLNFNEQFVRSLNGSSAWQFYQGKMEAPSLFKLSIMVIGRPHDTYIDMKHWNRGLVIVNTKIIGRYWNRGPQTKLFISSSLMFPGENFIYIFELHKPYSSVKLSEKYL